MAFGNGAWQHNPKAEDASLVWEQRRHVGVAPNVATLGLMPMMKLAHFRIFPRNSPHVWEWPQRPNNAKKRPTAGKFCPTGSKRRTQGMGYQRPQGCLSHPEKVYWHHCPRVPYPPSHGYNEESYSKTCGIRKIRALPGNSPRTEPIWDPVV